MFLVTIAVTVLAILYSVCKHIQKGRCYTPPPTLSNIHKIPSDMQMIDNGTYVPLPERYVDTIIKFRQLDHQLSKSSVRYIRQIGQGNFGVVFMGRMSNLLSNDEEETVVAVKTLKDECQETLEDFAREARIMLQLEHPNIIKLYGVCADTAPYYLVFEYMDLGDLSKFLRNHASSRQRRLMDPSACRRSRTESTLSDEPPSLSLDQLSDICKQVASGMAYLAERSHVHRDLACRNCLVKSCSKLDETISGVIVKIGDFGMSHDLYQRNYYRVQGQAVLPVRWMSPEAVIYGKFSTAGDVWSFGILMWEVFSFAMQPYFGFSNEEVTKFIRDRRHLERPVNCPEVIYAIMLKCWSSEPDERPNFTTLQDMINEYRFSVSSESSSEERPVSTSPSSSMNSVSEDNVFVEDSSDGLIELVPVIQRPNEGRLQGVTPPPRHNVAITVGDNDDNDDSPRSSTSSTISTTSPSDDESQV